MGQSEIKQAIDAAVEYLSQHPDEARYTDSAATARLTDVATLRVDVTGPDGAQMATDMPTSVGGTNTSPSPGWFLRAAEASCVATLIAMRAAHQDVELTKLEVTADSESNDFGILGISDEVPAGPLSARILIIINGAAEPAQLREICDWAVAHCPVTDAVQRAVPIRVEVTAGS
jgi:uncharacterized OsmC-like protein